MKRWIAAASVALMLALSVPAPVEAHGLCLLDVSVSGVQDGRPKALAQTDCGTIHNHWILVRLWKWSVENQRWVIAAENTQVKNNAYSFRVTATKDSCVRGSYWTATALAQLAWPNTSSHNLGPEGIEGYKTCG